MATAHTNNPILCADYSDPDVVRAGNEYYLVASSFDAVPGLPILHSVDLVNWEIMATFLRSGNRQAYSARRNTATARGRRLSAITMEFHVYWPDPDIGIYMAKAKNANGPRSAPLPRQ